METIERIRNDLKYMDPKDFYYKHIVKSHNWYFSEYLHISSDEIIDAMDRFKEIVTSALGITFHSVQIVGSAKTGFSLSPTSKLLKPFHDEDSVTKSSDIDIAIVSEKLYNQLWEQLRCIKKTKFIQNYNAVTSSMFGGFINDRDIKRIDDMRESWEQRIHPINIMLQDELGFVHPISYRVYRSWRDLEEYQIDSIIQAKKKLEEQ